MNKSNTKNVRKLLFVGEKTSLMKQAFDLATKSDIECVWITIEDVEDNNSVYVIEEIISNAYHQKIHKASMLGPCYVIKTCSEQKTLQIESPTVKISACMTNCVIAFTSIPHKQRENYRQKIALMNGQVSNDFHEDITHLIAAESGSRKFIVASHLRKPIVRFEWLDNIWTDCRSKPLLSLKDYEMYTCPLFKGLTICVSGLSTQARAVVKERVEELGGNFSGSMNQMSCTHLIVDKPEGQKYEYAKKWRIHTVSLQWLNDCYEKKEARDEFQYQIKTTASPVQKTSTPNASMAGLPPPEVSLLSNVSNLEETILDSGNYMDGCQVLLRGFNQDDLNKLKKLVSLCGAINTNTLNDSVTHVVVSDHRQEGIDDIQQTNNLTIVSEKWLIDCAKQRKKLDTSNYEINSHSRINTIYDNSINQSGATSNRPSSQNHHPVSFMGNSTLEKVAAILEQFDPPPINTSTSAITPAFSPSPQSVSPSLNPPSSVTARSSLPKDGNNETILTTRSSNNGENSQSLTVLTSEESTTFDGLEESTARKLFSNLTFRIHKNVEDCDSLKTILEENGATIKEEKPDYYVVPINECILSRNKTEVITDAWIWLCLEKDYIVKLTFICRPLPAIQGEPLTDCVICLSGFQGVEREVLIEIAKSLGATVQDQLCRKDQKQLKASTHLILKEASGNKFEAARRWRKFAIRSTWLRACLMTQSKVDETDYDVELPEEELEEETVEETQQQNTEQISTRHSEELVEDTQETVDETETSRKLDESRQEVSETFSPRPDYIDSPSVFLNPDKPFKPRLRLNSQLLKSTPIERKRPKFNFNFADECSKSVGLALQNSKDRASPRGLTPAVKRLRITPLGGVVIGVSTKLADQQRRLNEIAERLGAEYRWNLEDGSITHLISDRLSRSELEESINMGRKVVSAKWIENCLEENRHLEEEDFLPKMIRESSAEDEKIESDIQALMELDDNRVQHEIPLKKSFCGLASFHQTQQIASQPQKGDVRWEDNSICYERSDDSGDTTEERRFILSGFTDGKKKEIIDLIMGMDNAQVIQSNGFDSSCTHMIVASMTRNEKILSAISTGKWILRLDYILDSCNRNEWLEEESYEWAENLAEISTVTSKLSIASRNWRTRIKNGENLPYQGWNVGLFISNDKVDGFRKILTSGGAQIAWMNKANGRVTHCFVDTSLLKFRKRILKNVEADYILKSDYMVSFLMGNADSAAHEITF
ncbi:unnamed protein product [Dimorphilus gyrociliatus]|uniref:BRCT domain-containing protein n=1 Tax=Dimorphilus gyrociliatus TaxID=2664684 RepID=A0A7I8VHD8_9ANNE|nr:unnamed protein product [Dimorphilus gyrociliatus]